MPSDNRPLPEPMLTQLGHMVSLGHDELNAKSTEHNGADEKL